MTARTWAGLSAPAWLLLTLLLALPAPRHAGVNAAVRFAATVRLVDAGTLSLGPYASLTSDLAVRDGQAYSDKAPGVTLALVPYYWVVRWATRDFDAALRWCRLLSLLPLTLGAAWALRRRLPQWGVTGLPRETAPTVYLVGTTAWAFFVMPFSHGYVADFVLLGSLWLADYRRAPDRRGLLAAAGLMFGATIAFEYPAALLALAAGLYLLSFERRLGRLVMFGLLGAALPALVIGAHNWAAFGGPLRFGYSFEQSQFYREQMARGVMGAGWPTWEGFRLITLSPARGWLFWSPVLLAGFAGLVELVRRRPREGLWLGGATAAYWAFFSGYFEASGGASLGPRHLVPLLGPLTLAAAFWAAHGRAWRIGAFVGLAALSSLLAWIGVFSEPQMPDRLANPLWEFALPMLREGVGPGNLLGLPDAWAAGLALTALVLVWALLGAARAPSPPAGAGRPWWTAGGAVVAAGLAFYGLVGPRLPATEPGVRRQVLGNHFMGRGDWARAAQEYETAAAFRADPWILYYQAKAYAHLGASALARQSLWRLWQADPALARTLGLHLQGEDLPPAGDAPVGPME